MWNKAWVWLFFILCSLQSGQPLAAQELLVLTEDLAPLNYQKQGQLTGYGTELLQAMLAQSKISAEFKVQPWTRSYQQALTQPNSLIYSIARTREREELFEWIGPISPRRICLIKLKSRTDIHLKELSELSRYKLGLVREMASSKLLMSKNLVADSAYDFAPSGESNIRKLMAGRVDLIVGSDWVTFYEARKLTGKKHNFEVVWVLDESSPYYFALNKESDAQLIKRLRNAFEKLKAEGQVEKLRAKYAE